MKIHVGWLRDFLPLRDDPALIKERLVSTGRQVLRAKGDVIEIQDGTLRPDLLGHLGVARELAASLALDMKPQLWAEAEVGAEISDDLDVQIMDEEICSRFSTLVIKSLHGQAQTGFVRERILSVGLEPADPVTDVIRFVMLATGQPVQALDRRALTGRRLLVRRGQPGETLRLPGGKDIPLSADMPVIADEKKPLALAGITVGEAAGIISTTREVVLISGIFAPDPAAAIRRRLGIRTDSSDRTERGGDFSLPPLAVNWAGRMLSGEDVPGLIDLAVRPYKPRTVVLRKPRIAELLGAEIEEAFIVRTLTALGFRLESQHAGIWQVKVPSFRSDIEREADLIEEVARFYGVDRLPAALPRRPLTAGEGTEARKGDAELRSLLFHQGFDEAVNSAFSDPEKAVWFGNENLALEIRNPLDLQSALLRTTLLPGLLGDLVLNLRRGAEGIHLFEIGRVFLRRDESPVERRSLALVTTGRLAPPLWLKSEPESDFFFLKGTCEGFLRELGFEAVSFRGEDFPCLQPGRSLALFVKGEKIGFLGRIRSDICEAFGIDRDVWGAEIDLAAMASKSSRVHRRYFSGSFPCVSRSISFHFPSGLNYQTIRDVVDRLSVPGLEDMSLSEWAAPDAESGSDGRMTLQFRVHFPGRDPTEDEADALFQKIVKALQGEAGLQLIQGGKIDKRTRKD